MALAARTTDLTDHPGALAGPGVSSVFIEGKAAAVVGKPTFHACTFPPGPHPPCSVAVNKTQVFIKGCQAARLDDKCLCGATIKTSALTVSIG